MTHRGFNKFPKIHRLGHRNTRGLLDGPVVVSIKLDGANASIWRDHNGVLQRGSRNRALGDDNFRGFGDWVDANSQKLHFFFDEHPDTTIYGEWLIQHQVQYPEGWMNQFYIYDVFDVVEYKRLGMDHTPPFEMTSLMYRSETTYNHFFQLFVLLELPISPPQYIGPIDEAEIESILEEMDDFHEGVVLTQLGEKHAESRRAKVVRESFKEVKGVKIKAKPGDDDFERLLGPEFVTPARVEKAKARVVEDRGEDEWDIKFTGQTLNTVFNDILAEEIQTIERQVRKHNDGLFNFKSFKHSIDQSVKRELGI